jgi:hypothetical protein
MRRGINNVLACVIGGKIVGLGTSNLPLYHSMEVEMMSHRQIGRLARLICHTSPYFLLVEKS